MYLSGVINVKYSYFKCSDKFVDFLPMLLLNVADQRSASLQCESKSGNNISVRSDLDLQLSTGSS